MATWRLEAAAEVPVPEVPGEEDGEDPDEPSAPVSEPEEEEAPTTDPVIDEAPARAAESDQIEGGCASAPAGAPRRGAIWLLVAAAVVGLRRRRSRA